MVKVIFSLFFILLSLNSYALTKVTASVDNNPVVVNESLILTVVANDSVNTNAFDTSSLLKNFIVGRTSVNTQTSMVNLDTSRTTTWTTVLIPRTQGELIIPAFEVDGVKTQPITIKVIAANDLPSTQQQDLFITTEVSTNDIYVQQQITLKVKLHFAAQLKRGNLTDPVLASANIAQIGQDKESENIINGKRYRIIERVYSISPQQSGDFILKSPVFSGEIIAQSSRRSNYLSFGNTKPVSVVGDDIALTIKAIPEQVSSTWLPSELLALHEEWQPDPKQFKVGEPITRTITLTAAGLSQEQLPEIKMSVPQGLKVYPDQAELHTGLNNERLVSQKVTNFAIVASQAGEYQLPDLSIPWWNTVTNKAEVAKISGRKIMIHPNPDIAQTAAITSSNVGNNSQSTPPNNNLSSPEVKNIYIEKKSIWESIYLTLWLVTSLAWFISAKRPFSKKQQPKITYSGTKAAYLELMAACKQNNGEAALKLLIPWARAHSNNVNSAYNLSTLDALHTYFNHQGLSNAIIDLQQSYYGKNAEQWHGANLLTAIQDIHKNHNSNASIQTLEINP